MGSIESSLMIVVALTAIGLFLSMSHLADRDELVRWLALLGMAMADLSAIGLGILLAIAGLLGASGFGEAATSDLPTGLANGAAGVSDATFGALQALFPVLGAVFAILGVLGLSLLLTPVRRLVARVIPIDPDRVVHASALHLVLLLVAVSAVTAVTVSVVVTDQALIDQLAEASEEGGLLQLWAQGLGFVIVAFLGVGLLVHRGWRETLDRLGLAPHLSSRWWIGATGLGLASGIVIDQLWTALQPESIDQVERLTDALFGPYLEAGLLGAVTIGLSAGIGEELVFRGAAQPRMGLVFTSLMFAALHVQYTVSPALIQMMIMGLLLGLVRRRANTTTAIAAHASYNFLLVVLALYLPDIGP